DGGSSARPTIRGPCASNDRRDISDREAEVSNSVIRSRVVADIASLRSQLQGSVVAPGVPGWDEARLAGHPSVDQRPELVALVESAADVAAVVRYAADNGLRVAPQGTGHNAIALGDLADTILLKTERLRGVTIDPEQRIARAEAGVIWIEVVE